MGATGIRLLLPVVAGIVNLSAEQLPRVEANQNHTAAGVVRDGVLTIRLEIAKGEKCTQGLRGTL